MVAVWTDWKVLGQMLGAGSLNPIAVGKLVVIEVCSTTFTVLLNQWHELKTLGYSSTCGDYLPGN
jgi:hypothetical protein